MCGLPDRLENFGYSFSVGIRCLFSMRAGHSYTATIKKKFPTLSTFVVGSKKQCSAIDSKNESFFT